ncbi:MAG: hypothetical protein M5U31_16490 [Acidimicrobiia bacterium]|nr:hypothetical protein [Acidimicrobiia bacterium]
MTLPSIGRLLTTGVTSSETLGEPFTTILRWVSFRTMSNEWRG